MSPPDPVRETLRRLLRGPLPGREAHRLAWPEDLPGRLEPPDAEDYDSAAVLIALHREARDEARLFFPLILRPAGIGHHSGQIALPGGRCDASEEPCACALREAEEEIGLARDSVDVLGMLTPVPVAVSRNRVRPVVGWVRRDDREMVPAADDGKPAGFPVEPRWRPQAGEVDSVLVADPDLLAREAPRRTRIRLRNGGERDVPAWIVPAPAGEAVIWGATAIILAEFLALWRRAREERLPGSEGSAYGL